MFDDENYGVCAKDRSTFATQQLCAEAQASYRTRFFCIQNRGISAHRIKNRANIFLRSLDLGFVESWFWDNCLVTLFVMSVTHDTKTQDNENAFCKDVASKVF